MGSIERALKFFKRQRLKVFFNPKKRFFFLALLFFGLLLWTPRDGCCQNTGFKYLRNFSPKEHGLEPQNWAILQDKRGIIYAANHGGVLEFDGVSWREIKVPNNNVRSLAIDDNGTIYVGGNDEIGFLAPDEMGALQYKSLVDHLSGSERNFSRVLKTHVIKERVYFGTNAFIFRWNTRKKEMEEPLKSDEDMPFKAFFICDDKLFIRKNKVGLMQMEGDELKLTPGGETFAVTSIWMMVPYDTDSKELLIGTREKGFYIYDRYENTVKPFPTAVDDYVQKYELHHGIRLSSGDFALATIKGGVIIIDPNGHIKHKFTKDYGLQDDDVKYVFEDSQGNLWLGLNEGISKIQYGTPISVFDDRSLLPGMVLSVVKHQGNLFAGTSKGLFMLAFPSKQFSPISGIPTNCHYLLSLDDSILAATEAGVFHIANDIKQIRKILSTPSYFLLPSKKNKSRIWVGTKQGLVSLYREKEKGQWVEEQPKFKDITAEIRSIVEDQNGNLWLGSPAKGVLKINLLFNKINGTIINYNVEQHYKSHQLPIGEVYVFKAVGRPVLFGTTQGLYYFNEKEKVYKPDSRFGDEFAGGTQNVFRLTEDINKNIWFYSKGNNVQAIPMPDGNFDLNKAPTLIASDQVNTIYPDPMGNIIWFASEKGIIRYDTTIGEKKIFHKDFPPLIRKVWIDGKLRIDGFKEDTGRDWKDFFPPLPYKDRNLRFEFAAPFFLSESLIKNEYQYRLEGYDDKDKWSDWADETRKDYTNLDSGNYMFQVRTKNVYGELECEAVFKFKILPPWYKTWWAFLLYGFFAFLTVYFIVKWRYWRLHQEKQRLEQVVKERTKEINEKNQQLEKQTVQLQEQSEKLKELDHMKSRFFANISHEFRTPLTLIMGPLEQMLTDDDEEVRDRKDRVKLMLRNSQRLLNLINQLLDLSKLDSGKMKLQPVRQNIVPFLKGLTDSFHFLAAQNKLELTFQSEEEDITLYFDLEKLEKVVCNLLSNAIKFTPPGGKITVKVKNNPTPAENFPSGWASISVADTGVGIPKEQVQYIFDRFYQAAVPGEHAQKGSGIGLALTKELVTLHHGEIDFKSSDGSEGENRGTEFTFRLPLGKEHLKPEEIVDLPGIPSQRQKPYEVSQLYAVEKEEEERDVEEKDIEPETQEKEIILVVEDSRDVRKYIRGPLEKHYTVVETVNGKEGIEKAREIIPDLIISDIMMPEADGYELCSVLKQDVLTCHIPIVLLTAKASEENVVQGLETGADDYITKPFNTKILMARIRNLIDLRRQLQQKMKRQMMLQPAEISVSSIDEEFIKELQGAIEKNLSDPEFTVEELGKKLYMSRASLYRKIQALTGESPNHFIRNYRLKRAAQLLKENFGNVTEVAFEVGFSSSAYFTKCFKEQFQQLPSSFQASESPSMTH
jgi:signal transduction histidine kinase/DNA-binding response OmpR family regulator